MNIFRLIHILVFAFKFVFFMAITHDYSIQWFTSQTLDALSGTLGTKPATTRTLAELFLGPVKRVFVIIYMYVFVPRPSVTLVFPL